MAVDPVCGMDVNEHKAAGVSEFRGQKYYFCSTGCKAAFDKDPEKYLTHTGHAGHSGHSGH